MSTVNWSRHWMLGFVPIAIAIDHVAGVSAPVRFLIAALAIVPVARLIGSSTEHLAHYTGDSIGGLLNAIFGNLPEIIIGVTALQAGLYAMVAASIIGAILFNLLLVMGLCFLLGGLRRHTLTFNAQAVRHYSTMMFISVISLALPSIYERAFAADAATIEQEKINIGLAVLLLALYGLYLLYMIRTHPEEFASVAREGEPEASEEHEQHWSLALCIGVLVVSSVVAAVLSEILVGAVEGTGEALGLSPAFLGIVLLASVGGVAEGMSAVDMARKGRFDLSLGIALGSCILIALFVAPVLVFASYFVGPQSFLLSFNAGGVTLLFLSVLIGTLVASGGSGNWYKGVQLIAVYLMVALLLYFVPQ
ncbi:MAG TPA: calcium/proton exchanger [Gammaproteobacteria bacterium]|nr:calcium/proton exchanger [Gammaproteobacteria bacterium]